MQQSGRVVSDERLEKSFGGSAVLFGNCVTGNIQECGLHSSSGENSVRLPTCENSIDDGEGFGLPLIEETSILPFKLSVTYNHFSTHHENETYIALVYHSYQLIWGPFRKSNLLV